MKEITLTKEQEALFDFSFDYDLEFDWQIQSLFHYRSGSSLESIFDQEGIILRLTEANHFDDKLEGKAVEVYYDIALEEMRKTGKISEVQLEELSWVEIPKKKFLVQTEEGIYHAKWEEFDAYIVCFSVKKDDPYMYEHYVNHKETGGFCIEFLSVELNEITHRGMDNQSKMKLIPVMYGRQVVDYIQEQLSKIVRNPYLYKNRDITIGEVLHQVQFSAKRIRYSKENEVRLLVYLAKGDVQDHPDIFRDYEDGKVITKYINLRIPKNTIVNVSGNPHNADETTGKTIRQIKEKGYLLID